MRILVCGGRDYGVIPENVKPTAPIYGWWKRRVYRERAALYDCLYRISPKTEECPHGNWMPHNVTIIHGGAKGADQIGEDWAISNWQSILVFPADWSTHGKKAGVLRNTEMLREGKPDVVVAAKGGKGTGHMISIAKKAKVRVIRVWVM